MVALQTVSNFITLFMQFFPSLNQFWPHHHPAIVDYVTMEILFTFEVVWVFPVVALTLCEP